MLEKQLGDLLMGTADAAFAVDLNGDVVSWNGAAECLFGYPANFAIGKPCMDLIGGRTAMRCIVCRESCAVLESVRRGKEVAEFDLQIRKSSGRTNWVNVSLLVVAGDRVRGPLVVHFMRDIQRRKIDEDLTGRIVRMARSLAANEDESSGLPPIHPLTSQEIKILLFLSTGMSSKEIASALHISIPTLRNHLSHVNKKLNTTSRIEAVLQARRRGLI